MTCSKCGAGISDALTPAFTELILSLAAMIDNTAGGRAYIQLNWNAAAECNARMRVLSCGQICDVKNGLVCLVSIEYS